MAYRACGHFFKTLREATAFAAKRGVYPTKRTPKYRLKEAK
jgi:hypothetical protein